MTLRCGFARKMRKMLWDPDKLTFFRDCDIMRTKINA